MYEAVTRLVGENLLVVIIVLVLVFISSIAVGVLIGNTTAMKILIRFGIPVYSGKPHKDYKLLKTANNDGVGWLSVPDTVYAPIMCECNGKYRKLTFLNKESSSGELVLSEGQKSLNLKSIAKPSTDPNNLFHDLAIIEGSSLIKTENIRYSQFTRLRKYINSELRNYYPDIVLIDNGKKRIFNLLFTVELGIENRKKIKFTDRESFILSMRKMAQFNSQRSADNNIIILSTSTVIDTLLVFLVEKED